MSHPIDRNQPYKPGNLPRPQPIEDESRLAMLFRDMRAALGISVVELAARLNTSPTVVLALESGQVSELPPWTETKRVVEAYGAQLDLDVGPALKRLGELLPPASMASRPKGALWKHQSGKVGGRALQALQTRLNHLRERLPRATRPKLSRASIILIAATITAGLAAMAPSRAIYAGLAGLSPALPQSVQRLFTRMTSRTGPDGLVWIDVPDPRSRKADRLNPTPAK